MALDQYGRDIDYLRISLTDQCNLRCVYCMPEDLIFQPDEKLLMDEEVLRLASLFSELGFRKIRLTGGEPTLRQGLPSLVQGLVSLPGIREVAMTTNAVLLKHLAAPLKAAGLSRLNVSLDTLDPVKFRNITRWGSIQDAWNGLVTAEAQGLGIKINAVIVRGWNDGDDAVALARLTRAHPWQVRFIEMMPLGRIAEFQQLHAVHEEVLVAKIAAALGELHLQHGGQLDGEARLYRLADGIGSVGFISSVSNPFCSECNRVRLTADGKLRLCLLRDDELDVKALMRGGASDAVLKEAIAAAIWRKPWGHGLADQVHPRNRVMSEIGG
ncbi:MAG: GTP 3',8-cyclase MoaA [Verrucomicrobia bacterium]|nr:GTP 3',8-cyclase MoaA [Kiritimatiellia bacterium]MCP5488414.1 GTP 3',8-cyclase MoaA [Verrucomicrobiota bacterium]